MLSPASRRWGAVPLIAVFALGAATPAHAAPKSGFGNVVNRPFATVANGPLSALVVDVAPSASPEAVRAAVAARVRGANPGTGSALALQADVLRRFPPYHAAAGPPAELSFDDVVVLRSNGKLVASTASTARTAALGGGVLSFSYQGWTAAEEQKLRTFAALALPAVQQVYGSPATSGTIRVVKDTGVSSTLRNGGGFYNASLNEIHLYPSAGFPEDAEQVNLNFLHLIVHAFHDDAMLRYDAWEEGFARAATIAALEALDPSAEAPKPGGSIVRYTNYYLLQLYDLLNQPALGNDRFLSSSGWDGMFLWRNAMATAAWLKVYTEQRDFFARFNAAYYAQFTTDLAGNVPALTSIAAGVLPNGVEGLPFADWYRRQYALDTSVTPGPKLFVYNAPRFPGQNTPPSSAGWSQQALVHYFRTDGRTGAETPLSGTVYPIAWSWQYGRELPLEDQYQVVVIQKDGQSPGVGFVTPTFYNIGDPVAQRVTIDYAIGGESVRTYLPVTFTGVEPNWNDLLGVTVGGNATTMRAQLEGGVATDLTVTQGGFGGRLAGGALSRFSRTLLTATVNTGAGPQVLTRQVNTGYDYYVPLLTVGDAAPRRLSRTIPAGVRMLTVPALPFRSDPAGDFGLPAGELAMARWNGSLAAANKYESFPLTPPFRPGRGFWVKLPADRPLQVDGTPADPSADAVLSLPAGWNQIGSPWETTVPLAALRVKYQEREMVSLTTAIAQGWIAPKLWHYVPGAGYQAATTLDPWDACWLKVNVAEGVSLILGPEARVTSRSLTSPLIARVSPALDGWRLRLVATAGSGSSELTIGASRGATTGFDARFDVERPPSLGDADAAVPFQLTFLSSRGPGADGQVDLDTDVRALRPTVERWTLAARTAQPHEPVTLTLTAEGLLPRSLWLRDLRTGRRVPLAPGTLSLTTGADGVARWQIEAAGGPVTLRPGWGGW
jgi:hypothetical protein